MNIVLLLKLVPDTVEEIEIAVDGKALDPDVLRLKPSDPDEHALEQALLLKERGGGTVTVVAIDSPEVDDTLFTALAKGADRAVKLTGDLGQLQSLAAAKLFCSWLKPDGAELSPDTLILTRSQAIDDLEAEIGPVVAELLELPYLSVVTGVQADGTQLTVTKEFAGGLRGRFQISLPAVLGIQSAEKPPRYVPIAKVRSTMKTATIETVEVPAPEAAALAVEGLYKPQIAGRARMLDGAPEAVADELVELLTRSRGN